jgi:hypothetical protein
MYRQNKRSICSLCQDVNLHPPRHAAKKERMIGNH